MRPEQIGHMKSVSCEIGISGCEMERVSGFLYLCSKTNRWYMLHNEEQYCGNTPEDDGYFRINDVFKYSWSLDWLDRSDGDFCDCRNLFILGEEFNEYHGHRIPFYLK
jgi:hypothetical protein